MFTKLSRTAFALAAGAAFCATSANAFVVNDTFSGNWGDVDGGSRGLIIDVIEDRNPAGDFAPAILVEWFTYRDGQPFWLISNSAQIDRDTNTVSLEFFEFDGGAFATPDLGSPTSSSWGTATLKFNSCNEAVMTFNGVDGMNSTTFNSLSESRQCVVDEVFASCPSFATTGPVEGTCIIGGGSPITDDIVLTNETTWLIQGQFLIGDGGSVTIEPNTEIVGGTLGDTDVFIVQQGGQVFAEGTQENPIIMRGFLSQGRGEWGGMVINGRAPINACGNFPETCLVEEGEAQSGAYGGDDPEDNSGVLRYVVVSNAGVLFDQENELNGIAFQGVGRGTTVEYVQVHLNADDGVEFFGGTVNAKHLVLTGIGDDSLDWTEGWTGNVQYVVAKQYTDDGDQGIEADNNGDFPDYLPRSLPTIANATFIGQNNTDIGWLIRAGTGVNLANSIAVGFGEACLDVDDAETFANEANLSIVNSYLFGCASIFSEEGGDGFDVSDWFLGQDGNAVANPMLSNYVPMPNSPVLMIAPVPFTNDFFDNVNYAGAVPSQGDDWTRGWTVGLDRDEP